MNRFGKTKKKILTALMFIVFFYKRNDINKKEKGRCTVTERETIRVSLIISDLITSLALSTSTPLSTSLKLAHFKSKKPSLSSLRSSHSLTMPFSRSHAYHSFSSSPPLSIVKTLSLELSNSINPSLSNAQRNLNEKKLTSGDDNDELR